MPRRDRKEVEVRVLAAIDELSAEGPPTYREVAVVAGISHSAVHGYVVDLRAAGLVHVPKTRAARTLRLTPAGKALVAASDNADATPAA